MLESFLDQWAHRPNPQPSTAQEGALAKQLIAVLKECINRRASDEEVAKEVRAQLRCTPQTDPVPARSNPARKVAVRPEPSCAHNAPYSEWHDWEASEWRDWSGWQDWGDWPPEQDEEYGSYWEGWRAVVPPGPRMPHESPRTPIRPLMLLMARILVRFPRSLRSALPSGMLLFD